MRGVIYMTRNWEEGRREKQKPKGDLGDLVEQVAVGVGRREGQAGSAACCEF